MAKDKYWPWVAFAWLAAATWFAWRRTPYDDEWFSIELALQTDPAHFWGALQHDVHPPWLACLDRFIASIWHSRLPLHGARLVASALAVGITVPWLAARARLPQAVIWLAAFHPIVFMYAGSERWYPFLLLAQALRARALWGDDAPRVRQVQFAAGAAVGSLATYVDPWFVLVDIGCWLVLARSAGGAAGTRRVWQAALASVVIVAGIRFLSPLAAAHRLLGLGGPSGHVDSFLIWAGLGSMGEAGPPWPWLLIGLAVPAAFTRAVWLGWRNPTTRSFCIYLMGSALAWAVLTPFRVWHPRYSLWIWFVLTAWTFTLWRSGRIDRCLLALSLCCWAAALGFMGAGRGFYKADLNELTASDCAAVQHEPAVDLLVISYARLAELIAKQCAPTTAILRLPSIRIFGDEHEQMAALRSALRAKPRVVRTLRVNAESSLVLTDGRVRAVLSETCRSVASRAVGDVPHHELKSLLRSGSGDRFVLDTWLCR